MHFKRCIFYFLESGALKLLLRDASSHFFFSRFFPVITFELLTSFWAHRVFRQSRARTQFYYPNEVLSKCLKLLMVAMAESGSGSGLLSAMNWKWTETYVEPNHTVDSWARRNDAQCNYNVPVGVRFPFICESGILCANAVNVRRSSETNKLLRRKRARALIAFRFALPTNYLLIHYLLSIQRARIHGLSRLHWVHVAHSPYSDFNHCTRERTFFHSVIEFMRFIYLAAWIVWRKRIVFRTAVTTTTSNCVTAKRRRWI